jgi:hypothetical protein
MNVLLASIVDGRALLETVIASLVTGVGVTVVFSFAILGAALFGDARRDGRVLAAAGAGTLMGVGLLGALTAIAFGLIVMMS